MKIYLVKLGSQAMGREIDLGRVLQKIDLGQRLVLDKSSLAPKSLVRNLIQAECIRNPNCSKPGRGYKMFVVIGSGATGR